MIWAAQTLPGPDPPSGLPPRPPASPGVCPQDGIAQINLVLDSRECLQLLDRTTAGEASMDNVLRA